MRVLDQQITWIVVNQEAVSLHATSTHQQKSEGLHGNHLCMDPPFKANAIWRVLMWFRLLEQRTLLSLGLASLATIKTIAVRAIQGLDSVLPGAGEGNMNQTPVEMRQKNSLLTMDREKHIKANCYIFVQ